MGLWDPLPEAIPVSIRFGNHSQYFLRSFERSVRTLGQHTVQPARTPCRCLGDSVQISDHHHDHPNRGLSGGVVL
jgi:hypothetical protein